MKLCPKCQKPIIRAGMYDPDGEIPLYEGLKLCNKEIG